MTTSLTSHQEVTAASEIQITISFKAQGSRPPEQLAQMVKDLVEANTAAFIPGQATYSAKVK